MSAMYHNADSTAFSYRDTSANNFQASPPASVPLSSHSPFRFYSRDTPDSGSNSSTGSSPEIPSHTITCHSHPYRIDDQLPWTYSITGDPYHHEAQPRPLESPLDLTFSPTPYIGDPRTRLDQRRIRTVGVVFTDDARRKLGEGVHRWCFNCRATETTTWRRSSLSPGKLLCNRCGLFERTHHVPRPEKFPRRRRARPSSVFPVPAFGGEQWQCQNHLASAIPPTQFFQPFDAVSGQSIPQNTSWMTQHETGPSLSPVTGGQCYPTSQQQIMYHGNGQI